MNKIYQGDNLQILPTLEKNNIDLIYIDPPFNTGKKQKIHNKEYNDNFENFEDFLLPRIEICLPLLKETGCLFVHLNYREVHYIKIALDKFLGRDHFINELIWCWDFGFRPKKKWPIKHDTILWYVKDPDNYTFNYEEMDRLPYMAPGLAGKEKVTRGKTPTDCWWNNQLVNKDPSVDTSLVGDVFWNTIVSTTGSERVGYPTQKPLGILNRIIKVHSNPGDTILDFFAGSGTTGISAALNNRNFILIDENPDAIEIIKKRLDTINCPYIINI